MADLTEPESHFDTGVEGAIAVLHGHPQFWSFSALKEVEACPQRYLLSRASYPQLWDRAGYPRVPSSASLFGDIVHDALEALVTVLVTEGCETFDSPDVVGVLKPLGGISAAVKLATDRRLRELEGNPRLTVDAVNRIARTLGDRAEEARAQVQNFLGRVAFPKGAATRSTRRKAGSYEPGTTGSVRHPASKGTHSEITLVAEELRLMGRVDLITVGDNSVIIVDYKTGSPDPSHVEQVNMYALLWHLDSAANPHRLPVSRLRIAYSNHDTEIGPDEISDLNALERAVGLRVEIAENVVAQQPPEARPNPKECVLCPVKGLCSAYWSSIVPDLVNLEEGEWFDFEGVVGPSNGVRSRWMLASDGGERKLLLRTPPNAHLPNEGDSVRLLGIRLDHDPEIAGPVAVMSSGSEVLTLRRQIPSSVAG